MNSSLNTRDLIGLGFMTFALFLGAGNIIFPPQIGQQAGDSIWLAAIGFLLTGVGLPLVAVVALARIGNGLSTLTQPIGKVASLIFGILIYLTIGPLFATPRTATVSFTLGFVPFIGESKQALALYSFAYFSLVTLIALFPGRLLDTVGKLITPVLIIGLALLALAAIFWPAGTLELSSQIPATQAFAQGFTQGYQTMDALAAIVFGIVIINAIRERGITETRLLTRYTVIAGIIAALGLALVYVSLIWLGASSGILAPNAATGAPILSAFVSHAFGPLGNVLLAAVIILACLTTAIGLVSACGIYFSQLLGTPYKATAIAIGLISMLIANQGLDQLIAIAEPVLLTIYPVAIALVALNLGKNYWHNASLVFRPTLAIAAIFGLMDGIRATSLSHLIPAQLQQLPGADLGLGWIVPVILIFILVTITDNYLAHN